jgi:hypothetical protein
MNPPLAKRHYRHPGTGEEAVLSVGFVHPPHGPFLAVWVLRADGKAAVRGIAHATWVTDRARARRVWAERARELRSVGYERVRAIRAGPGSES